MFLRGVIARGAALGLFLAAPVVGLAQPDRIEPVLDSTDDQLRLFTTLDRQEFHYTTEQLLHDGDTKEAAKRLLRIAEIADPGARDYAFDAIRYVGIAIDDAEEDERKGTYFRFAFETLKDHPVARTPAFVVVTNLVPLYDESCDLPCELEVSAAGIAAIGGIPDDVPEDERQQKALMKRLNAVAEASDFEEAEKLIPLAEKIDLIAFDVAGPKRLLSEALGREFDEAEPAFHAGNIELAKQLLLRLVGKPADFAGEPDLGPISRVFEKLYQNGELARLNAFSQFAVGVLAEHPVARTRAFAGLAQAQLATCGRRGQLDCVRQTARIGLQAVGGVRGAVENNQDDAVRWQAAALVLDGKVEAAVDLLKAISPIPLERGIQTSWELDSLAQLPLAGEFRTRIAEAALAELDSAKEGTDPQAQFIFLTQLGNRSLEAGALVQAETSYRLAHSIALSHFDRDSIGEIDAAAALGEILSEQGRWDDARPFLQRNWEVAEALDDWSIDNGKEVKGWVRFLLNTGERAEADRVSAKVWNEAQATPGITRFQLIDYAVVRAEALLRFGLFAQAEQVMRRVFDEYRGRTVLGAWDYASLLAEALEGQDRFVEAEEYRRFAEAGRFFDDKGEPVFGITAPRIGPSRVASLTSLAANLSAQGKLEEAEALYEKALELAREMNEPSQASLGLVALNFARNLVQVGRLDKAASLARTALEAQSAQVDLLGAGAGETAYLTMLGQQREAALLVIETQLALGEVSPQDMDFLFEAAQRAEANTAASATALSVAQNLARKAGAGDLVEQWQSAQVEVAAYDRRLRMIANEIETDETKRLRADIAQQRHAAFGRFEELEAELEREFPRFFDLARPAPVSPASAREALSADEALVVLVAADGDGSSDNFGGAVLVLTREEQAAAPIAIASSDLEFLASELHAGLAEEGTGETISASKPDPAVPYPRESAHELYEALFGAPRISALLADKQRWTLVPQGSLLSVSYEALVSQPPEGGQQGDFDPLALRATNWLGLERALAIAPSVSSIPLARLGGSRGTAASTDTFVGIGDPAFRGEPDPPVALPSDLRSRGVLTATRAPGAASGYFRGGVADLEALARLDRLVGTQIELQTLAQVLEAPETTLVTQLDATEARVNALDEGGQLARAGLVVFATHGLIASDGGGLSEPALALTPPPGAIQETLLASNDGLLSASEAAALDLAADLLILSACNTAAGTGREANGLTGLARGFLFAGARALLVSHFPVSDRATPLLTSTMVAVRKREGLDRAAAMQEARRRMLADERDDADGVSLAHPKAWAALTLVSPE